MNITEEKRYIYNQMSTIVEERRILTDIYYTLKERLNALDELERKGLDELSIKGYVDLYNEQNHTRTLENTKRELANITGKLERQKEAPAENNSAIPAFAIAEQKFKDNNKIVKQTKQSAKEKNAAETSKRPKGFTKWVQKIILHNIQKNPNTSYNAAKMYEILSQLEEFRNMDVDIREFRANMFYRVVKNNEDIIKKVGTGTYQLIKKDA